MSQFEVEQKFRVDDLDGLERRIVDLGARFVDTIDQVDAYYAHPNRDFAVTDEALRIRSVGDRNWITYKGPKAKAAVKTREEVELPLGDGGVTRGQMARVFEALGFRPVAEVCKRRRAFQLAWRGATVECALDVVDGVGDFAELELTTNPEGLSDAQMKIQGLADELALTRVEIRSYLELVLLQRARGGGETRTD